LLVILGEPPPPAQPAQGSFDDPTPRHEDEAATGDAPHDDQVQPEVTSVKLVEIRVRREMAIGQAARGGIWMGSAVSVAASLDLHVAGL
jgi:class 3 adenylate cyclase